MYRQTIKDISLGKAITEAFHKRSDPGVGHEGASTMKTFGVQKEIFKFLRRTKYKKFCEIFVKQNPGLPKEWYFNPKYNQTNPDTILYDSLIEKYWKGTEKVFKALFAI